MYNVLLGGQTVLYSGENLCGLQLWQGENVGLSLPDTGRIRYNTTTQRIEFSEDGGIYYNIGSIDPATHGPIRQLIHFIDEGPADGFLSGAYRQVTGTLYPTAIIWYDSAAPTKKKIVEKLITWTGVLPTAIVWKMYDTAEVLVITVTDLITYSGIYETSRTRVII